MPSQMRRQYTTVEVKPGHVNSKSNLAPSSPGSPKAVRFAPSAKAVPRALTTAEAWSLYHFETHCRQCHDCYNPMEIYLRRDGRRMCSRGISLAQDVAEHVCRRDGVVYSMKKDAHKMVTVEMPPDYDQVHQLLKVNDTPLPPATAPGGAPTPRPIISYDAYAQGYEDERADVILEPAVSRQKSKHRSTRYSTIIVDEDVEATTSRTPQPQERRGSLYDADMRRQRKEAYKVEIREPQPERKDRDRRRGGGDRPKSAFWL